MSKGELRCCGSPLFLKSKYGSGYNLIITRKKDNKLVESVYQSNNMSNLNKYYEENSETNNSYMNQTNEIIKLVKSKISTAKLSSNVNTEISFVLPTDMSEKFPDLFNELDKMKDTLNILNVGISITTVEEVFLK
jgi:hypothetical protein